EPRDVAFSHIRIDRSQLKKMLTKIRNLSPNSEFKRPILKEIQDVIDRSSTIGDFFSKMITFLLGDRGLIIVEPRCLRELMVPIFRKLIRNPTEC
ncbi:MAG: bacillithiol biosynthesis BshC, partial [Candidatus Korarchaeota archaeon]|nr:bacillithiol biosynthesis BshC [Candidatus Korarchaeota archaeon]